MGYSNEQTTIPGKSRYSVVEQLENVRVRYRRISLYLAKNQV
jgi:hypothetical protein